MAKRVSGICWRSRLVSTLSDQDIHCPLTESLDAIELWINREQNNACGIILLSIDT